MFSPAEILDRFSGWDTLSPSSLSVSSSSHLRASGRFLVSPNPGPTFSSAYPLAGVKIGGTQWDDSHSLISLRAPSFSPPLVAPCPGDKGSFWPPHLWRTGTLLLVYAGRTPEQGRGQTRQGRGVRQTDRPQTRQTAKKQEAGVRQGVGGLTEGERQLNTSQLLFRFKDRQ